MLLLVYTTTSKRFVIFTCSYFKLSWNTTALSQSNCRNFSCSSIKSVILPGELSILCNTVQIFFSSICKQTARISVENIERAIFGKFILWRCQIMQMRSELIRHSEIKDFSVTSWPDIYFRKTLYFFSFSPKYKNKNKQGIFLHNCFKIFAPARRRHPNVPRVKKKYRIVVVLVCETFPIWWN